MGIEISLIQIQGVPHLREKSLTRGPLLPRFWPMYAQMEDFRVSRGPPTVPLTQILRTAAFLKSQNPSNSGTLCICICHLKTKHVCHNKKKQLLVSARYPIFFLAMEFCFRKSLLNTHQHQQNKNNFKITKK